MQKGISYTTILHQPRIKAGLTCNEYVVVSTVYHLQNNDKTPGWCHASKEWFADLIGLTKRSVIDLISKLEDKGFLAKKENGRLLKATKKWVDEIETYSHEGEKISPKPKKETVKKVHQNGEESSPRNGEESSPDLVKKVHPIIIEDNNNSIKIDNDKTPSGGFEKKNGSKKFEKHPHLIKAMASDFDVAFSYLSGITTKLHWGAAAAEKINWNAKEIGNIGYIRDSLRNRIEAKDLEANDENILENWRMFLEMTIGLKDDFLSKNFVPSMIYSQFNKIILRLNQQRNGKSTNGSREFFSKETQRAVIEELVAEGFFDGRGQG